MGFTNRLDEKTVTLAVAALFNYLRSREKTQAAQQDLFDSGVVPFQVVIALKRIPEGHSAKLHQVELPNSFRVIEDVEDGAVEGCIFVKDPPREVKDLLEKEGAPGIKKVIGLAKLRAKTKTFEEKRRLCDTYDVFFADKRIIPLLPKVIGKKFFDKKKQPIPVNVARKSVGKSIEKALRSTHFTIPTGPSLCVTVGSSRQTIAQVVENIMSSMDRIVDCLPRKWRGVQAIHVKASKSTSLPLFTSLPQPSSKAKAVGKTKGKANAKVSTTAAAKALDEEKSSTPASGSSPAAGGAAKSAKGKRAQSALQRVRQRVEDRQGKSATKGGEEGSPKKRQKVGGKQSMPSSLSSEETTKTMKKKKQQQRQQKTSGSATSTTIANTGAAVVGGASKGTGKGQQQSQKGKSTRKNDGKETQKEVTPKRKPTKSPLSRPPRT